MIRSFGSKETEKIWNGIKSTKLPGEIQNVARRKLRIINNSFNINDLRVPPSNRLEKLKGGLSGFMINGESFSSLQMVMHLKLK